MLVEKYRPKTFDELVGQEHVKKVIMEKIKQYNEGRIERMPHFLFAGPPGVGKCLTGDTPVIVNNEVVEIGKLVDKYIKDEKGYKEVSDLYCLAVNEKGRVVKAKISHVYKDKSDKIVIIRTRIGRVVKCTPEHPLLVNTFNGDIVWKRADEIRVGEKIAYPVFENNNLAFDEVVEVVQEKDEYTVYDLVVPGYENFIGGNLPTVLHNTSVAYIIARELHGDKWKEHFMELNASDERGIEVIREKVKWASKVKGGKIIFLDEADRLTPDSQAALRRIMETTSKDCFFILSCNDINGIIEPIQDRCVLLYFKKLSEEEMIELIQRVLDAEGVEYKLDNKLLSAIELLIDYADGSARRLLNQLEKMIIIKDGKKILTPDTVIQNVPEDISVKMLQLINRDQLDDAIKLLEDLYIENRFDPSFTIKRLYRVLRKIDDKFMRAVAYRELAKVEETVLKYNCNPLIQFSRFIATLWLAKYSRNVDISV